MQKVLPEPYIYLIEPEHYQNMIRDISVSAYMLSNIFFYTEHNDENNAWGN